MDRRCPSARDLAAAERWIAGDDERRRRELSLDLVVERDGEVAGEVGLSSIDRAAGTVEIGWWTAAGAPAAGRRHRPRRRCSWRWARDAARARAPSPAATPANPGSVAVAERAGAMVLL